MSQMVVIGAGPAGIMAALESSRLGFSTHLISDEKLGGRANWHSLLPSKVYLTAADYLVNNHKALEFGSLNSALEIEQGRTLENIRNLSEQWEKFLNNQLRAAGVNMIFGQAKFAGDHKIKIQTENHEHEYLRYDKAVIAAGSVPVFPQRLKPDGQTILAPRFASKLTQIPESTIVVGGGVTGSEFAYLFNALGSRVTWLTDIDRVLPRMDFDLSSRLEEALTAQGIELMKSSPVQAAIADLGGVIVSISGGKAVAGSRAFIAVGRRADIDQLELDTEGINADRNGIVINEFCQTTNLDIYAVGDVTGPPFIANRGQAQAYTASRHAAGDRSHPFQNRLTVEAVYTHPQAAMVGMTEAQAEKEGKSIDVFRIEYSQVLKTNLSQGYSGFLKLVTSTENGVIVGGGAVGEMAADLMSTIAVAMQGNLTLDELSNISPAYPTYSELIPEAARRGD